MMGDRTRLEGKRVLKVQDNKDIFFIYTCSFTPNYVNTFPVETGSQRWIVEVLVTTANSV